MMPDGKLVDDFLKERKFRRFGGNDQLSADFMLDAVLAAKLDH